MDISNSNSAIEEWSEHVTDDDGRSFWYNRRTRSSTYNKVLNSFFNYFVILIQNNVCTHQPRVLMTEAELSIPPCQWTEYMNEDGKLYYSDGETSR